MAVKRSLKLGAAYFFTIVFTLALIGGGGVYVYNKYLNVDSSSSSSTLQAQLAEQGNVIVSDADYEPTSEESRTGLFIYDSGTSSTNGICIAVIRFVADEGSFIVMPLQSDIYATINGEGNTLYNFYKQGGITQCKKAVEETLGITIDKYMKLSESAFITFADYMGNIVYDVPCNIMYGKDSVVLKSGTQEVDSSALCKLLTYGSYDGGEEYRAIVIATAVKLLLNSGVKGMLADNMDLVFSNVINSSIETDITKYDYDDSSRALSYVVDNYSSPAKILVPSGTYNSDGSYQLEEGFLNILKSQLSIE